jgi:MFS family permease
MIRHCRDPPAIAPRPGRRPAGSAPRPRVPASAARPARATRQRLGSARPFAFALAIDAFGSGLFLPFSLLYFNQVGGLSLTQAGLGLSIAMLMAVPAPLLAGVLIDRSSPKRIMLLTNTARVAGFLGFLFVHDLWALIAVALLVAVSDRLFWVAHPALVAELAGSGGRDRWFGLTTALRCAGLGAGGLLAGLVVSDLVGLCQVGARDRPRRPSPWGAGRWQIGQAPAQQASRTCSSPRSCHKLRPTPSVLGAATAPG